MPIKRLTCPHCEQAVEVQVTSVTRSRPCPRCGRTVFLQVAEKENKVKRKALLMPTEEVTAPAGAAVPTAAPTAAATSGGTTARGKALPYEPQSLEGDAFERMKADPELVRHRKAFFTGLVVVLLVAAGLTVRHYFMAEQERMAAEELEGRIGSLALEAERGKAMPPPSAPAVERAAEEESATAAATGSGLKLSGTAAKPAAAPVQPQVRTIDFNNSVEVLGAFLKAPSVAERLKYVLSPGVMEGKMKRYHQRVPDGSYGFRKVTDLGAEAEDIRKFEVVLQDYSTRIATALLGPDGYRIDWGSFVLYSDMTFDELRKEKPTEPVLVRVLVQEGKRFDGAFSDPNWLRCIEIREAAQPEAGIIYAYVEKNSTLGGEVDYWLRMMPDSLQGWTLGIRYPVDAAAGDQVWLDTLMSTDWLAVKRVP